VLSDCVEKDIVSKVRASPAVGILCDESTDVANFKQLVVFVRFVVEGKSQTSFLKIADLMDGTAGTIETALLDVFRQCEIPTSLIFSFGSDGASVMMGRHTGVAARLRVHNPEMVSLHCGAHRVALASSQAAEDVLYMKTFDNSKFRAFPSIFLDLWPLLLFTRADRARSRNTKLICRENVITHTEK